MSSRSQPVTSTQIDITLPAFLRNQRVLNALFQIIFIIVAVYGLSALWSNILDTLAARNLNPNFAFLEARAGFRIADSPDWYNTDSTFGDAFIVGIINTLRVVTIGLVLSTILGVLLGIFLLSRNWLVHTISRAYVEILRNTPLLVQLIFWYFVVILGLPRDDITLPNLGILVIPLRVFAYIALLVGIGILRLRREDAPRGMLNGAIIGIIALELIFALIGYSTPLMLVLGVAGGVLAAVVWMGNLTLSKDLRGRAVGAGVLAAGTAVAAIIFVLAETLGILGHPTATWTEVSPAFFFSRQGIVMPQIILANNFLPWAIVVVVGFIVAYLLNRRWKHYSEETGTPMPHLAYATGIFLAVVVIGWFGASLLPTPDTVTVGEDEDARTVTVEEARAEDLLTAQQEAQISSQPIDVILPIKDRFRFSAGTEFSPEYVALLVALVIYTSAFIGEVVRAGIQAVPYGQIEASRAVGLTTSQTLRLVILPQALRVIIPPMGNQYLNLAKNSSLAVAIAYTDTYQVGQSIMSTSGQSVTGFTVILGVYLTMSLVISLFMNVVNQRFELKTR